MVAGYGQDNGTVLTTPCRVQVNANDTVCYLYKDFSGAAWTNSESCEIIGNFVYEAV